MSEPIRLVLFTDTTAVGGAERFLKRLAIGLRERGFPVTLVCPTDPVLDRWAQDIASRSVQVARLTLRPPFPPTTVRRIYQHFREADVVHFNLTDPNQCAPAVFLAGLARRPVLTGTQHLLFEKFSPSPWKNRLRFAQARWICRRLRRVVSFSNWSKQLLIESYGVPPARAAFSYPSPDTSAFDAAASAERPPELRAESGFVVCMVGVMNGRKGHQYLIEAAPSILEAEPSARFLLVGDGEHRPSLERQAEAARLNGHVRFLGYRNDVPAVLAASDALVLPSFAEDVPLVVLEAMAAGLPVVASDVGGVRESVIHGVTGLLVQPGDAQALAEATAGLARDRDLAREMGRQGRRRVETAFSLPREIDAYEEMLRSVLAEERAGQPRHPSRRAESR